MEASDLKKIVWLASYPKSGNTWMRMFLQSYMTKQPCDINGAFKMTVRDMDELAYRSVSPVAFPNRIPEIAMGLRFAAMLHLVQRGHGGDIFVKTHNIFAANQEGQHLCPPSLSKMAVYMIRDPRDIVVSFSHHLSKSIDETINLMIHDNGHLEDKVLGFGHHMSSWGKHAGCWVKNEKIPVCVVRYEGLIANPQRTFAGVTKFLFGHTDYGALAYAIDQSSFAKLRKQEQDNGFLEQKGDMPFFRSGKVGKWKDILTNEQIERLEIGLGDSMDRMGYPRVTTELAVA